MKIFLFFLLVNASCLAQGGYRFDLNVRTTWADTVLVEKMRVLVEFQDSFVCFTMREGERCYQALGISIDRKDDSRTYLLVNSIGDRYTLKIVGAPDGVVIFLTNVEKGGYPHYVMRTRDFQ